MKYFEVINQKEQQSIIGLENLLSQKFNISNLSKNGLIVCMSNSARSNELGLPNMRKYALIGDKYLDFLIYESEVNKNRLINKGELDDIRQSRTNKVNQHSLMLQSGIANYILVGGSQPLSHYLKYSIHPVSDQFEALVYIIYINLGKDAVIGFLKELNFL